MMEDATNQTCSAKLAIKLIKKETTELLCSGQVIRNLADIAKELVENSLDSGANSIDIVCKDYGKDYIEIIDNGEGIEEKNFPFLALKHFTSKLERFEDLKQVSTLGFRGEALASIATLGDLTIYTKHINANEAKKLIFDQSGNLVKQESFTRYNGTTVRVENLFRSLPVRKKAFLENYKKDYNDLIKTISHYAIGYLNLKFTCSNFVGNKKNEDILITKNTDIKDNIIQMFGIKFFQVTIKFIQYKLDCETIEEFALTEEQINQEKEIKISGYLSNREKSTGKNGIEKHFFYVNKRPVIYKKLGKHISNIYKQFNGSNCPFAILQIIIPGEDVDINLTPDKRTLHINLENLLFAILKISIIKMYETATASISALNTLSFNNKSIKENKKINFFDKFRKRPISELDTDINNTQFKNKIIRNDNDLIEIKINECDNKEKNKKVPKYLNLSSDEESENEKVSNKNTAITDVVTISFKSNELEKEKDIVNRDSTLNNFEIDNNDPKFNLTDDLFNLCPKSKLVDKEEKKSEEVIETNNVDTITSRDKSNNPEFDLFSKENDDEIKNFFDESFDLDFDNLFDQPNDKIERREIKCTLNLDSIKKNFSSTLNLITEQQHFEDPRFSATITISQNEQAENELRKELKKSAFKSMKVIGQFNKGFIIAKLGSDIFIIDQHASDEKFNYEYLCKTTILQSLPLVRPVPLGLTSFQESIIIDKNNIFEKNGFYFDVNLQETAGNRIKLISVPTSKEYVFGKADIEEMLQDINELGELPPGYRPSNIKQMLGYRACRKSIMIGDSLKEKQMIQILNNMSSLDHPWTCAHGRPTIRHLFNLNTVISNFSDISYQNLNKIQ